MNLPKQLEEKRDFEVVDRYMYSCSPIDDEMRERYNLKSQCFKEGFNAAAKLILESEELKGLVEAVEETKAHYDGQEYANPTGPEWRNYLKNCFRALKQWKEFVE